MFHIGLAQGQSSRSSCVCWSSPLRIGQLPVDVILGVQFQFGVFDMFLIGEGAIQCYKVDRVGAAQKRWSRPCDVKRSVCFPVPEMEQADLALRRVCV